MNSLKFLFLYLIFFLFFPLFLAHAEEKINKFGIHILEPTDLSYAADLVNSSGGDWGWITVVIREDDLNFQKWQNFMNQCREKHLIPLVRIATHQEKELWAAPFPSDVHKWINFLNNLNWPVKTRYLIIFNEPNQAKEWGGKLAPEEYAQILNIFIDEFKNVNPDFQILNAGFDLAAPNSKTTMEVVRFWQKMNKKIPGIFEKLDGWVSHSYPNPGFKGKPTEKGKTSIRGYQWELATLKNHFNLKKELPVFITETGWPKDNFKNTDFVDPHTAANYFKFAFEEIWLKDKNVKAITPFVLNYPQFPFSEISWLDTEGKPFPQYYVIQAIPKQFWWPPQEEKYVLGKAVLPPFLFTEATFNGKIPIKNIGQSILGEKEKFSLSSLNYSPKIYVSPALLSGILKPYEEGFLDFEIKTGTFSGEFNFSWEKMENYKIRVLPPSILRQVQLSFWEKVFIHLHQAFKHLPFLLK